jgi:NitT/TauT family transport system ATP-binding protein
MTAATPGSLRPVRLGYVPLVDAALLIAARAKGFAAAEGLDLRLVREGSWAAVRDKLNVGLLDAAHMLAPAAVASHLGLGHLEVPLAAPMALNLDGNAITLSSTLAGALATRFGPRLPASPDITARAFAELLAERRAAGLPPPVAAVVFPWSTHMLQLRAWLALGGISPEDDIRIVVIPPPLMVESLAGGLIDLFCSGAPWNRVAEEAGSGRVLHRTSDIMPGAMEKLLVTRSDRAECDWVVPLVRAVRKATAWAEDPAARNELAEILAAPDRLDVSPAILRHILAGTLPTLADPRPGPWIRLDGDAIRPAADRLDAILSRMAAAGQIDGSDGTLARARTLLRPDLFAAAD